MASSSAINAARSLTARTVHIKMHPTPRSFSERREVLRVLERFGEVSMFRSYKYHPKTPVPNAFLSLFASESAAREIINASPIRYRLISEGAPSPTSHPLEASDNTESGSTGEAKDERTFELYASPSSFCHETYLSSPNTNPLHGPFTPINPNNSFIGASLDRNINPSIWSAGMKDWETDAVRARSGSNHAPASQNSSADGDIEGGKNSGNWNGQGEHVARFVSQRERKRRERTVPRVMKGLRALKEERTLKRPSGD